MEMYNVHQDAALLPLQLTTEKYLFEKDSVDAVNASAPRDKNGLLHISLVNVHATQAQTIKISLNSSTYTNVKGRILQSAKLPDHNSFEKPGVVTPKSFAGVKLTDDELELTLPPYSVVVLEIK